MRPRESKHTFSYLTFRFSPTTQPVRVGLELCTHPIKPGRVRGASASGLGVATECSVETLNLGRHHVSLPLGYLSGGQARRGTTCENIIEAQSRTSATAVACPGPVEAITATLLSAR